MVGKYDIEIYNNKVHYYLTVKRNITILQGNSATGKTELVRLVQEYETNGKSSGITLLCDAKCTVLTPVDWELRLKSMKGCIIFIDETAAFLKTREFAKLVRGSDNYFVLITRDDLSQLPYSVDEIYGLKNDAQKYKTYHKVYNEMFRLYHFDVQKEVAPDIVITEDSNSGYEFFQKVFPEQCVSAKGKSLVYDRIRESRGKSILAIVDGAAFGPEIGRILRYLEFNDVDCIVYAPESFEYLILTAGIIDIPKEILEETYLHADSVKYMSWEEFYTEYLTDITRNTVYQYGKTKLGAAYLTEGNVRKIVEQMPGQIVGR